MKALHSIRWRLQLWHGLMLALALAGFGFTAWRLQWENQLRRIDQELEERVSAVAGAMLAGGTQARVQAAADDQGAGGGPPRDQPPRDQPPRDQPPRDQSPPGERPGGDPPPRDQEPRDWGPGGQPPPPPRPGAPPPRDGAPGVRPPDAAASEPPPREPGAVAPRLPDRERRFFEGESGRAFYYVTWAADGTERSRSASAPDAIPRPEAGIPPRASRWRGTVRERMHVAREGSVLVGRDAAEDVAAIHRFGWLLAGVGGTLFLLGLAGGWWVSTRALQPVADISATAVRIASGDLSQRIRTPDTSSELGALADVLNDTFGRLQESFSRQARFTADASHELRTPVTVLLTEAQGALSRDRSAAEYRDSLEACQRAAQRMRGLIEALLTLARLDAGHDLARTPCDLDRIAAEAVEQLRPLAREREVTMSAELQAARCTGIATQLGQVVTNLVANAIHHNRPGGSVHVSTATEARSLVLTVRDTGEGIAPADLPHIFERFYRADKARARPAGRTGLGLAIVKAIVDAHHGTIDVTTRPGEGSEFSVRLPRG